jgi:RES domain-containing protein
MRVFRIGAAVFTRTRKEAFSGQGGVYASARWHSAGRPIVYTPQSLSLAALEILVRLKQTNDIEPFYVYTMEIPDHLILTPKSLPARWRSRITVSRAFGDAWLKTNNLPALRVPTVITPGEWNVLVNPLHPRFSLKWVVTGPDAYTFDARLCRSRKGFGLEERRGINDVSDVREGFFRTTTMLGPRTSLGRVRSKD